MTIRAKKGSNALNNRLKKFKNGFGIMTGIVAVATMGHGGKKNRKHLTSYVYPCKKCMGAKVLSRKIIRKYFQQLKQDLAFKKSILVCLVNIIDVFSFLSSVYMRWYLAYYVAFNVVGNAGTLYVGHSNFYCALLNVKYSTVPKGEGPSSFGD